MSRVISNTKALRLIRKTKSGNRIGRLFTVTFTKKNGKLRTMRARLGVKRNLTGRGMRYNPASRGLMPVWSAGDNAYRMLNTRTITSLSMRDPIGHRRVTYVVA